MLSRVLEVEVMDTPDEADDYNSMDHAEVNRRLVTDFLFACVAAGQLPARAAQGAASECADADERDDDRFLDVLDLGCGPAHIAIALCQRAAACRVMAVDLATSMLDVARRNIELAGLTDRIQLNLADAKRLPHAAGTFAAVLSNSIVHHSPRPRDVLSEAARVAAPGGVIFVRDLLRPADEATLAHLVAEHAAGANDHQRAMFAASLRAALTLDEIRAFIADLGYDPQTVQQTSDRHWTWSAVRSADAE